MKGQGQEKGQVQGHVDGILEHLGPLSIYAVVQWLGFAICLWSISFQMVGIVFTGKDVPHVCSPLSANTSENVTELWTFLLSERGEISLDNETHRNLPTYTTATPFVTGCESEDALTDQERKIQDLKNCSRYIGHSVPKDSSIVSEFELVCDRAPLLGLTQTLLVLGQILGSLLLPALADRWGRKRLHIIAHALTMVSGLVTAFSPNYLVLAVSKVFVGIAIIGLRITAATAMLEMFPTRFRSAAAAVLAGIAFAVCAASMAPLAYGLRFESWRTVQLVFTSASLLLFLQILILDEPLRWLLANNKQRDAVRVIKRAARWNHRNVQQLQDQIGFLLHPKATSSEGRNEDQTVELVTPEPLTVKNTACSGDSSLTTGESGLSDQSNSGPSNQSKSWTQTCCTSNVAVNPANQDTGDSADCSTQYRETNILEESLSHSAVDTTAQTQELLDHSFAKQEHENGTETDANKNGSTEGGGSQRNNSSVRRLTILDVFKHPRMRKNTIISCFLWFVNTMTYMALYLTSESLVGDLYINFFLNAIVEIPSCIVYFLTLDRYGRKGTLYLFQAIAGITLISSGVCRLFRGQEVANVISTVLSLIGKFGATGSLNVTLMYTAELFPTNCRNQSVGAAMAAGRIGSMIAPFATLLAQNFPWAPGALFGTCNLAVVCFLFFLPETMGRELPQTVQDLDNWYTTDKDTKPKKRQRCVP